MRESDLQLLRGHPLFAEPRSSAVRSLCRIAVLETVSPKALLLREGNIADSLYLLVDGLVQLFASDESEEATVLILRPGTFFYTPSVLHNDRLPLSAGAVRQSLVARMSAEDVRRLVETDAAVARFLFSNLTSSCSDIIDELKSLRTQTALERLVAWILTAHGQAHARSGIELPYGKRLLAGRLGMAPETLSRSLAHLAELGVAIRGKQLQVQNVERLRRHFRSRPSVSSGAKS